MPSASRSRSIVDVLVAMMVSAGQISSKRAMAARLTAMSSNTASTTNPAPAKGCQSVVAARRASADWAFAAASLPCATRRPSESPMRCVPACRADSSRSQAVTFSPAANKAWAIPAPIVPIPNTPAAEMPGGVKPWISGIRGACRLAQNT